MCVDAPPVLEFAKHILDFVAAFVERLVERDCGFAVGFWRDAGFYAARLECASKPVSIVAFVTQQSFGIRNGIKHQRCTLVIAHLTFREQQNQRTARAVAHGVQFGIQAALGAPDTSGNSPFFKRLAAVRCAFKCVASIIT